MSRNERLKVACVTICDVDKLLLELAFPVALLKPSHTHPLPCTPAPAAVTAALHAAKLPNRASMSVRSSPVGSPPPPLPAGARFSQKMLWLMWPPVEQGMWGMCIYNLVNETVVVQ